MVGLGPDSIAFIPHGVTDAADMEKEERIFFHHQGNRTGNKTVVLELVV